MPGMHEKPSYLNCGAVRGTRRECHEWQRIGEIGTSCFAAGAIAQKRRTAIPVRPNVPCMLRRPLPRA